MQLRTSNIIMIIKGNHNYGNIEPKDAIKKYMAKTCECNESDYNDGLLMRIISVVVQDFIATADDPQKFMYHYFDAFMNYYKGDFLRSWISALQLVQIKKYDKDGDFKFLNGFNISNVKVIDENTGKPMFFDEGTDK